ncbi:MAG TPA: hypothetical protein VGF18_00880 [Candidatus Tumulicola sp.]|jgi:hypothetical protein
MSPRLAQTIVALYPRRWRGRYGDEFAALLQAMPPSPSVVFDACLPAVTQRAVRASFAIVALAIIAVSIAGAMHYARAQSVAFRPSSYSVAQTACRAHAKLTRSAFAGWHRCLD